MKVRKTMTGAALSLALCLTLPLPAQGAVRTDFQSSVQAAIRTDFQSSVRAAIQTDSQSSVRAAIRTDSQSSVWAAIRTDFQSSVRAAIRTGSQPSAQSVIRTDSQSSVRSAIRTVRETQAQKAMQSVPDGTSSAASGAAAVALPEIQAEGAVVIDGETGAILYGKNETKRFYPASTTKLMTALLVLERAGLGDTVTFSKRATSNLEAGASTLKLTEGDRLTVEQCLYGLLLKSANEIGNGLAEHIAGSVSGFAALMNQKAAQLGCTGTNFTNPHGLNDSNHYTTPYDMALIARAAFQNETLCKIDTTTSYRFPATKKAEAVTISMGHKMMYPTDSRYYEGIIGGKTGYTSLAGNTLVTGVQRDGTRLIAVVMKSKATHYADTKALLDYGFAVSKKSVAASGEENPISPSPGPSSSQYAAASWMKDDRGWYYRKADGSLAAGEWLNFNQTYYWIDLNGYMATGWRRFNDGLWYYFQANGTMATDSWAMDNGKWFYLGSQGFMLTDTRTPDGYLVGSDGAWITE